MSERHEHPLDVNHRGGAKPDGRPSAHAAAVDAALDAYASRPTRGNDFRVRAALADRIAEYCRLAAEAFDGEKAWPTEEERDTARDYGQTCAEAAGAIARDLADAARFDRSVADLAQVIVDGATGGRE